MPRTRRPEAPGAPAAGSAGVPTPDHLSPAHAVRRFLAPLAAERGAEIMAVSSRALERSTSYPAVVLTAELSTGESIEVFLKDFGSSRLSKDDAAARRERELRVYRDLLPGTGLGTAGYHGSVWGGPGGRHWLLLEYVDGIPLRHSGIQHWIAAAGWIGRLQGCLGREARELADFLLSHDAAFYLSKAERAIHAVTVVSSALGRRLAAVLEGYEELVELLVRREPTLVHGSYRPQNIIVTSEVVPRLCPTDWELAGLGSPLHDVAYIADGFRSPELERVFDAYRVEAESFGLAVPEPGEMRYEVDCLRLHKTVRSLGQCVEWRYSPETVAKLVAMAEDLRRCVAR